MEQWTSHAPLAVAFNGKAVNFIRGPFAHAPLVVNLHRVVQHMKSTSDMRRAMHEAAKIDNSTGAPSRGMQMLVYPALLRARFVFPALPPKITQRLRERHPEIMWQLVDFNSYFSTIKKVGGFRAMASIKTSLGAWCASAHMHESEVLPCLFGCEAPAADT